MTIPVLAIIIGISNYHSKDFQQLPAAQSDATKLARFLVEMGIAEDHIFLLNGPFVSKEQFAKCVEHFSSIKTPFQLLFYFCGHGYRSEGERPESYLIFSDTQSIRDGVSLEALLLNFFQIRATGIYLFLDACSLRFNSLANPKYFAEIQGEQADKTLFCLLSSGIFSSFENASQRYGYFTDALVKALRNMAFSDRSPESLTKFIRRELQKNGLALPEMYNIGTHTIDIFSPNHNPPEIKKTMNRALAALYSCGMVIDERLFCKEFNLPESSLPELESLSLIFFEKGAWHPHDTLNRIVEREKIQIEHEATKSYWFQQFQELPDHFDAALHFVMAIQCFGYEPKYDHALQSAYSILSKAQALDILKESIAIYPKGTQAKSARFLAELFIGLQQFDFATTLLDSEQPCAARCHLLWRTGCFSDCIQEATKLISSSSGLQAQIPFYWHRGTAHYLAGNWNPALSDFGFIERHSNHPMYVGRSLCILGTLTGIRGINLEESQARIETGIRMLLKNGDQSAAWVGWNNLGEIMWKAGNWKLSQHYLNKSLDSAQDNHTMILETLRNFLHLELRNPQGTKSALQAWVDQIEQMLTKPIEIFESMQIYNSLCKAHLALANLNRAQFYLNQAIPVTILSKEFHIYTLSNLAAMCQKNKLKEKADAFFNRALTLAKEGNNLFAIQQIQCDRA